MASILGGATSVILQGRTTYKSLSQSGLFCADFHWPLLIKGKPIQMKEIWKLKKLDTFIEQRKACADLGFSLFVKPVRVGKNRHIRVRPQFNDWSVTGDIAILDSRIKPEALTEILRVAGQQKGLGDWRPAAPKKPGPWGMFDAKVAMVSSNGTKEKAA
jgi:hypothetical protein